jgi:hypothetical protein
MSYVRTNMALYTRKREELVYDSPSRLLLDSLAAFILHLSRSQVKLAISSSEVAHLPSIRYEDNP